MTEGREDPPAPGVRADVGPRTDTLRGGRTVRGELGWSSQRPLLTTRPREPVGRPPRKPGPKGRFHCRCLPSGDGPEGAISLVERFSCFSNGQRGPPSWLAQSLETSDPTSGGSQTLPSFTTAPCYRSTRDAASRTLRPQRLLCCVCVSALPRALQLRPEEK